MLRFVSILSALLGGGIVITKRPFNIVDVLDEPIFFEYKTKEKGVLFRGNDHSLVTLRDILKDYEDLKGNYEKLREEHEALQKEHKVLEEDYSKFKKHMGKGRANGTYKLNSDQIQKVLKLYENGISKRQIAKKFKVDEKTVRNIIKRCS